MKPCPLCSLKLEEENVWYADSKILIMDTKDGKKGKPRIICAYKEHIRKISKDESEHATEKLKGIAMRVFTYTDRFQIRPGTYKQIRDHWHMFASEVDHDHDGKEREHITYSSKTGRRIIDTPEN